MSQLEQENIKKPVLSNISKIQIEGNKQEMNSFNKDDSVKIGKLTVIIIIGILYCLRICSTTYIYFLC